MFDHSRLSYYLESLYTGRKITTDGLQTHNMFNSDMNHKPQYRPILMRGYSLNFLLLVVVLLMLVIMTLDLCFAILLFALRVLCLWKVNVLEIFRVRCLVFVCNGRYNCLLQTAFQKLGILGIVVKSGNCPEKKYILNSF